MNTLQLPVVGQKFGNFDVLHRLGAGGMGVVYLVRNPYLGLKQALKVLKPELAASAAPRERFFREIRSLANFNQYYQWIVQAHHADEIDGLPYLLMEYLPSGSIYDWVKDSGPLTLNVALKLALESANALSATSAHGLAHRDVKPSNILLRMNGYIGLSDFGLAAPFKSAPTTSISGTPEYMSPEQMRGETPDVRADIFSLGAVLHFMLTGKAPFGYTLPEILQAHGSGATVDPQSLVPCIPDTVAELVATAVAIDAKKRHQSAQELADHISLIAGQLADVDLDEGLSLVRDYAVRTAELADKRFAAATLETVCLETPGR